MQFTTLLGALALTAAASVQATVQVLYDQGYDDASRTMDDVACSNGANGLETRYGYETQGAIPDFPYIGSAAAIAGWNSPNCGTCWQLSYGGRTINILAIDHAATGFVISLEAMNALTNNNAVGLGNIQATAVQVPVSDCGI
ncbi:Sm1 protein [Xylariaceae sp. FL0255]|nr:Sm1 protein [Xylariaceae sp. FL0255]